MFIIILVCFVSGAAACILRWDKLFSPGQSLLIVIGTTLTLAAYGLFIVLEKPQRVIEQA